MPESSTSKVSGIRGRLRGRFGTGALNLSFEPTPIDASPKIFQAYRLALLDLIFRDVVIVAAAGNQRTPRDNWLHNGVPGASATVPHSIPEVMKIGATDFDRHLWDESRIVALIDMGRRHPVAAAANLCTTPNDFDCVPWVIWSRCINPFGGDQCGSSFGTINGIIDLVAPGAQVIGGMVHPDDPVPPPPFVPGVYRPVPPSAANPVAFPPAEVGLGVSHPPNAGIAVRQTAVADRYWGPMTGTSQSAPHVTATAGLMRSMNPLLSAAAVRSGLRDGANDNVPGYTSPRMGNGLLDARKSVELAAGKIRDTVLQNRLVPMFAFYARASLEPSEITAEEFEGLTSQPVHSWLHTTNPSLAAAALRGDIYTSPNPDFSPTQNAAYLPSHLLTESDLRIGIPIPTSRFELPLGAGALRQVAASFWVFTTPHSPLPGYTLQPLYRLSTDMTDETAPQPLLCAGDQRKHLYSTVLSEVLARTHPNLAHVCNAAPMDMRYHFESIEGYVYDRAGPQPPGTFPLFRVFNTNLGFNVAALVVQGESLPGYSSPGAADASNNPHFLGWVYRTFQPTQSGVGIEAADLDQDGLPNGVEIALGLNEQSANGDCEGANDAVEYGFANLPGDPMSPTATCTDGRLNAVYSASLQTVTVTLSNPIGPVALPIGTKVTVHFTAPAQGPVVLMGGGGSQCQPMATIGWDSAYECTLSSELPVGPNSTIVWQWTNVGGPLFQPGQNVAEIAATPGLVDPVPANNIRSF
jgi:hypothetical protein